MFSWKVSPHWTQINGPIDNVRTFSLLTYYLLRTFYIENDAEIFPVHYTWKVAEKWFKIAFMMNKLAMTISFEINLEK